MTQATYQAEQSARSTAPRSAISQTAPQSAQQTAPQNRSPIKLILAAVAVVCVLGAGVLAYIWFSGGDGQPSTPAAAPALVLLPGDTRTLFHIAPEASEVRFIIDEELLGSPKTVIGVTNEVAGDLLLDLDQPANSQLGALRINVRTLETDNEFRNRALRGQILQADRAEFEFAQFTPTALLQLPEDVSTGETVKFQITGNLTVRDVTREVTFDATLTLVDDTLLEGGAYAVVSRADFGLTIPEAPGVANVSDEVRLEIDFVLMAG